jgi:hypothetical protein
MIISMRLRWAECVACLGLIKTNTTFQLEKLKGIDHLGDLGTDGTTEIR